MVAVAVTRRTVTAPAGAPGSAASSARVGAAYATTVHPKMKIVPQGGTPFTVPFAPRDGTVDGFAPTWTSVDRGGRAPLLLRAGSQLPTMTFDLPFGFPDPNRSIESQLAQLRAVAQSGARIRVSGLDAVAAGRWWRLTGFTQTVTARQHGTNAPTRATCSLTFTSSSDPVIAVGPVSGGAKNDDSKSAKVPKQYVVRKGDTLQEIAKKFYGDTSWWRKIADAQKPKIRDPKKLKVGTKLTLPRKKGS